MPKTTHQAVSEFQLRAAIAGLAILDGILAVRNSIENANPAAGRTVLPALRTLAENPTLTGQLQLHTSDSHRIRHLAKSLEPMSAVLGPEGGDSLADVAARIRVALAQDPVIGQFFAFSGAGANVVMTAKAQPEAANDGTMNLALVNGDPSPGLTPVPSAANTTAGVAGVKQQETATAVGTVTQNGTIAVVVTAAGMTGSPKTLQVPALNGDTPAAWAQKVRDFLASDLDVGGFFDVSGTTTAIILTRKIDAANDGTMNVSLDNGTTTGVTTAATSANTTAGVAGVAQVETLTVVGAVARDGVIIITVTAAGMTGSPRSVGIQVQGAMETDVVVTDADYAAAKASASPAEQVLRASLVTKAQDYIPGFTGLRITNGGLF